DYRHSSLFDNFLTGSAVSNVPPDVRNLTWFRWTRAVGCALLVPVIEELFWRGWLLRWLSARDFQKVPWNLYVPRAFWTVAILFAAEHGPYWEVGLAAGIIYNWLLLRTNNLADCVLGHIVTNTLLSLYVLINGRWEYWL